MGKQEVGSHLPSPEQSKALEQQAVHSASQAEYSQLDREVCLGNLIEQLGVDCTDEEKTLLMPALIAKEQTLRTKQIILKLVFKLFVQALRGVDIQWRANL